MSQFEVGERGCIGDEGELEEEALEQKKVAKQERSNLGVR